MSIFEEITLGAGACSGSRCFPAGSTGK